MATNDLISTVGAGGITVTPPSDFHFAVGDTPTISSVTASGGTGPYTYYIYQGDTGDMTLATDGTWSGTLTNTLVANNVKAVAIDSAGARQISAAWVMEVVAVMALTNGLDSAKNVYGSTTTAFSFFLTVSGGRAPITWAKTTGTFPTGLSLNTSTGEISGTPSATGTQTLTFTATDANSDTITTANLSIVIDAVADKNVTTVTTTTYTQVPTDVLLAVDDDTAGGAVTITLLAASEVGDGAYIAVKKLGTTGSVTVDGNASETIDGATTKVLSTQYDSVILRCNGTAWFIEAKN